jgi:hypothetical protein
MNENLHITERIDNALNILNSMKLSGFDQWNPVCEAMKQLASLSQDVQKYEKDHEKDQEQPEEAEA